MAKKRKMKWLFLKENLTGIFGCLFLLTLTSWVIFEWNNGSNEDKTEKAPKKDSVFLYHTDYYKVYEDIPTGNLVYIRGIDSIQVIPKRWINDDALERLKEFGYPHH